MHLVGCFRLLPTTFLLLASGKRQSPRGRTISASPTVEILSSHHVFLFASLCPSRRTTNSTRASLLPHAPSPPVRAQAVLHPSRRSRPLRHQVVIIGAPVGLHPSVAGRGRGCIILALRFQYRRTPVPASSLAGCSKMSPAIARRGAGSSKPRCRAWHVEGWCKQSVVPAAALRAYGPKI